MSRYETDQLLAQYAEFHYGDEYFSVPNFPRAMARFALAALGDRPRRRALDLGCALGRASLELARAFDAVTGVDYSPRFITQANRLAARGSLRYALIEEGELVSPRERKLSDLGLDRVCDKVMFLQGDACALDAGLAGYDLILAANLIDRLYDPGRFLGEVARRINPGGLLVIASPYTWLAEHTPRDAWLGGFKGNDGPVTTLDGLKAHLRRHFHLLDAPKDMPFVIRETRRKFQHSVSEVTVWERTP